MTPDADRPSGTAYPHRERETRDKGRTAISVPESLASVDEFNAKGLTQSQ